VLVELTQDSGSQSRNRSLCADTQSTNAYRNCRGGPCCSHHRAQPWPHTVGKAESEVQLQASGLFLLRQGLSLYAEAVFRYPARHAGAAPPQHPSTDVRQSMVHRTLFDYSVVLYIANRP